MWIDRRLNLKLTGSSKPVESIEDHEFATSVLELVVYSTHTVASFFADNNGTPPITESLFCLLFHVLSLETELMGVHSDTLKNYFTEFF